MKIRDFGLEIFFGRYEFSAPYLLAQSDCESLSIRELLALEPGAQVGTVTVTDSSGDTLILPLVVPDGAARISTAHLWLQLLRAL